MRTCLGGCVGRSVVRLSLLLPTHTLSLASKLLTSSDVMRRGFLPYIPCTIRSWPADFIPPVTINPDTRPFVDRGPTVCHFQSIPTGRAD